RRKTEPQIPGPFTLSVPQCPMRAPRANRAQRARNSVAEVEDADRVAADHPVTLAGGDVAHRLFDDLARGRPVVAVVRVVARPHDRVDTDALTQLDPGTVGDERRAVVASPVERRRLADRELAPRPVAPELVVEHLDEVRQPPDADLDPRQLQLGKPVEHTG